MYPIKCKFDSDFLFLDSVGSHKFSNDLGIEGGL